MRSIIFCKVYATVTPMICLCTDLVWFSEVDFVTVVWVCEMLLLCAGCRSHRAACSSSSQVSWHCTWRGFRDHSRLCQSSLIPAEIFKRVHSSSWAANYGQVDVDVPMCLFLWVFQFVIYLYLRLYLLTLILDEVLQRYLTNFVIVR